MNSIVISQVRVVADGLERSRTYYTRDLPSGSQILELYSEAGYVPPLTVRLYGCSELSDERPMLREVELPELPSEVTPGWPMSGEGIVYDVDTGPSTRQSARITFLPTGKAVVRVED